MSIRLDPRRLNALKLLAGEAGLRPGELVTRWVEERLDAARPGAVQAPTAVPIAPDALSALATRVDELSARLDALTATAGTTVGETAPVVAEETLTDAAVKPRRGRPRKAPEATPAVVVATKVRRGRPSKAVAKATGRTAAAAAGSKVALHDEIATIIAERGPQTAIELAAAIGERRIYLPPRSAKPLDAAAVNARVSNPKYRPRFARAGGRIGLASE